MKTEIELHQLFCCPLYVSEISSITEDEFKFIEQLEYELMDSKNGKYTKNKYILECKELARIKKEVEEHARIFTSELLQISSKIKFYLTNSWSVLHEQNDYAHIHLHTNSLLSGILYTRVYENSGNIVFNRNITHETFPSAVNIEYLEKNILNARDWEITPKNNMIVLFPSTLLHNVTRNESGKNRYSLAFNFFAKGHLGRNEYELFLP